VADLHTDLWSINDLVNRASSQEDATKRFRNMHGFSLSQDAAHLALQDAINRKWAKPQTAQASFSSRVKAKYQLR